MPTLTAEQLDHFETFGFLAVDEVFDPEEVINPVMDEYAEVLDTLASELHAQGVITDTHADLPFAERVCQVYVESQKVHAQYFDFSLPQKGIQPDTPFWAGRQSSKALHKPQPASTPSRASST